jgi:hypothetical protein
MKALKVLSIQNCTGLTEDIDLTDCVDIEQVDASGTTINVSIPDGSKITKYELGAPTTVRIVNPTQLNYSAAKTDNPANISSMDIINIPNNKSFSTFAIMMGIPMGVSTTPVTYGRTFLTNQSGATVQSTSNNSYFISDFVSTSGISRVSFIGVELFEINGNYELVDYWTP